MNLAKNYLSEFGFNAIAIEEIAVEKDQDMELEITYWIFDDGSAIWQDSSGDVGVVDNFGLHADNEKLR